LPLGFLSRIFDHVEEANNSGNSPMLHCLIEIVAGRAQCHDMTFGFPGWRPNASKHKKCEMTATLCFDLDYALKIFAGAVAIFSCVSFS